jgi:hypothetical protein
VTNPSKHQEQRFPTPRSAALRSRRTSKGQRGFSLVIVFLLLSMMAAAALAVLLSARTDIRVSGHDRLNSVAFYSAEAGLAYAKGYVIPKWNSSTFWTPVLQDPQATSGINQDYEFGGTSGIPKVEADYTYRFSNNTDDPSGQPTVDSDGRVVIISTGRALDASGTRTLATVTLQTEVEWQVSSSGSGTYQAQPNQDVTGSAQGNADTAEVDMSRSQSL